MYRDKSPLTNLGYGVTSRDLPPEMQEEEKASSSSGVIARALDDKPVLKFVGTMLGSLAGGWIASRVVSGAGVKLAKQIQISADRPGLGRKFVETATKLRKELDALEGLTRVVDGEADPYSQLVFFNDASRTGTKTFRKEYITGSNSVADSVDGSMQWMTREEFSALRGGREPVAVWSYRDQLQRNLVKNARTLGVMLPATYVTQRGLTDKLFGNSEKEQKVNWYNPVDVLTDFVKQSTINTLTFILPQSAASAGVSRLRQLADVPYLDSPLPYSRNQLKTANKVADVKTILSSFGHDVQKMFHDASKISSSASYAFNVSFQESQRSESGVMFSMLGARRGGAAARAAAEYSGKGKLAQASEYARGFILGNKNKTSADQLFLFRGSNQTFRAGEETQGVLNLFPGFGNVTKRI